MVGVRTSDQIMEEGTMTSKQHIECGMSGVQGLSGQKRSAVVFGSVMPAT
jgi:hypothetical protein